MNYTDALRKEIEIYLNALIKYKSSDYEPLWNIVNEASRSEREYYEGVFLPLDTEERVIFDALREISKFNDLVSHIKSLIQEDAIRRNYQKLLKIREAVGKAFPNGVCVKAGENEVVVATKLLEERKIDISTRKSKLSEWQKYDYENLSHYMSENDRLKAGELSAALIPIAICHETFNFRKYSNLIQFLTLLTFRADCADCCPNFGNDFSIVFREEFEKICLALRRGVVGERLFCEKIFETLSSEYTIRKRGDFAVSNDRKKNFGIAILREEFLRDLLKILDKNADFDLFDLIEHVYNRYGYDLSKIDECFQGEDCKELVRLYRETPEQILITEQRYYQEKQLEQLQENARLERESVEEQAELDRRERAYQEGQNRRQMERDRVSRENAEREYMRKMDADRRKAEEKARLERRERERVEDQARRRQSMESASQRNRQMHLCWKCANYGHGCHGGIVACGNFRAKNR